MKNSKRKVTLAEAVAPPAAFAFPRQKAATKKLPSCYDKVKSVAESWPKSYVQGTKDRLADIFTDKVMLALGEALPRTIRRLQKPGGKRCARYTVVHPTGIRQDGQQMHVMVTTMIERGRKGCNVMISTGPIDFIKEELALHREVFSPPEKKIRFSFDPSYNSETHVRLGLMFSEDIENGIEKTRLGALDHLLAPGDHKTASCAYFFPTTIYQDGQQVHTLCFVLVDGKSKLSSKLPLVRLISSKQS
jgi:hypothetical protein